MCGIAQSSQLAQGSCVGEVDLWGLDEPLSDVREVRTEHDHRYVASSTDSQALIVLTTTPMSRAISVRFRSCPLRAARTFQEALVSREIPDLPEGAYVSLRAITAAGSRPPDAWHRFRRRPLDPDPWIPGAGDDACRSSPRAPASSTTERSPRTSAHHSRRPRSSSRAAPPWCRLPPRRLRVLRSASPPGGVRGPGPGSRAIRRTMPAGAR